MLYCPRLVSHLAPGFPVYGLATPEFLERPLRTIQAMAARLRRMIRAVQPDGPYRIAGWSFGATLAYEIAAQLIGEDEHVEFLGSLDGYYCGLGTRDAAEPLPAAFSDDRYVLSEMLGDGAERSSLLKALADENPAVEAFVRACQERSLIPAGLSIDEVRRYLDRGRSNALAERTYLATPIPIPLHLFAVEDGGDAGPLRNWEAILPTRQIRTIPVPGTHLSMMESPHIASLGKALSEALSAARESAGSQPERDYCPLVLIREAQGAAAPVLCVPGAGGTAISFLELAGCLENAGSIEALQPRGLDGTLVPHTSVTAAARTYYQWVQRKYPHGPVHLLGHSFGGWIAYEMASLFRIDGRAVASLTILDSEPPDDEGVLRREFSRTEAIMELVDLYEQAAQHSLEIDANRIDALDPRGQLDLLSGRLVHAGLLPPAARPSDLIGIVRTFEAALRARYSPSSVYLEPVRLVLALDPKKDPAANEKSFEETVSGWSRWAPNLTVWHSPGNHMTLLRRPHVEALSEWLSTCLLSSGADH
jgi:thioesterase domain-containing protein